MSLVVTAGKRVPRLLFITDKKPATAEPPGCPGRGIRPAWPGRRPSPGYARRARLRLPVKVRKIIPLIQVLPRHRTSRPDDIIQYAGDLVSWVGHTGKVTNDEQAAPAEPIICR